MKFYATFTPASDVDLDPDLMREMFNPVAIAKGAIPLSEWELAEVRDGASVYACDARPE